MAWDGEFDLYSRPDAAPNVESRTHFLRPLAPAREPPVSVASRLQYLRVGSPAAFEPAAQSFGHSLMAD